MTDQPINLTTVRANVEASIEDNRQAGIPEFALIHFPPLVALALIDAAEAAHATCERDVSPTAYANLRAALTKFTWTQP